MPQTEVTITEEPDGKWRLQGTTYIDNDINKPWPVNFVVDTYEEAMRWVQMHGMKVLNP